MIELGVACAGNGLAHVLLHLFYMIQPAFEVTGFVERVFADVAVGRDDVDAVVSGVLRAGVPVAIMSQVSRRVQALKSCEAFYAQVRSLKR
jgi:hypothetical protein